MSVRERLAIAVIAGAGLLLGCSSSNPRDINYGTDVGDDFTPPDTGTLKDAQVEESGSSVDVNAVDVSSDEPQDAAASDPDASVGGDA